MPRFEWPHRDDEDRRADERRYRDEARDERGARDDFGQADYSSDYRYDPDSRAGYRAGERMGEGRDYGQADYASDWSYDRERGRPREIRSEAGASRNEAYREAREEREVEDERRRDDREPRSWMDRAGDFLSGGTAAAGSDTRMRRRRGPSDRVLWAVIVERLEGHRGLDLSDVEVLVENCEVTLNGTVRRKEEKRRIEDIADVDGVRHVQNNLRVRDRGHWTFL